MIEVSNKYQVMPPLSDEEYQALKEDIAENGVQVPVVKDTDGNIIDGHHRVRAYAELLAEGRVVGGYPVVERAGITNQEKLDLAWSLNMQRRHLNREQKHAAIEWKLKESPEWADNRIAKLLGVDGKTVRFARVALEGRKEIAKLKKLVGSDGKEYPRELENKFKDAGLPPKAAKGLARAVASQESSYTPREDPQDYAPDAEERADFARKVGEAKKRSTRREERDQEEQRANLDFMLLEVDAHLSKARRELRQALKKAIGTEFDGEGRELLERESEAVEGVLRLFRTALTGDSGTDWDAALFALEDKRQWGDETAE